MSTPKTDPQNRDNLLTILDKIRNSKVLVVGDLMLDRFVRGDVTRISPESPIPVLLAKRKTA